jgi:Tfp pilus assembly protein PilX
LTFSYSLLIVLCLLSLIGLGTCLSCLFLMLLSQRISANDGKKTKLATKYGKI